MAATVGCFHHRVGHRGGLRSGCCCNICSHRYRHSRCSCHLKSRSLIRRPLQTLVVLEYTELRKLKHPPQAIWIRQVHRIIHAILVYGHVLLISDGIIEPLDVCLQLIFDILVVTSTPLILEKGEQYNLLTDKMVSCEGAA